MKDGKNKVRGTVVYVKYDNVDKALRTFSRKMKELGTLEEVKQKEMYIKPSVKHQQDKKQARNRWNRYLAETGLQGRRLF